MNGGRPRAEVVGWATELSTAAPTATLDEMDRVLARVLDELRSWDDELTLDGLDGAAPVPGAASVSGAPVSLRIDLVGELADRAANRGKRIRPVVAHWGWVGAGGPASGTHTELTRVAAAMELLHLFALVQDDVMDRSDERRGAPTMHVVAAEQHRRAAGLGDSALFGDSVAILLGDLALSEATLLVADAVPAVRHLWRRMTAELVQGQLLDVTQTASRQRGLPAVRRIARLKSGRYTITRPLQLGALVAGASPQLVDRLERYGDLVGDAFAVRDDILGVWGDPARTGKPAGDDLRSGKPTLLLALAHQHLPESQRHLLRRCDAGLLADPDVADLQQALVDCGVRHTAECLVEDLMATAARELEDLDIDPAAVPGLQQLADTIAWRDA